MTIEPGFTADRFMPDWLRRRAGGLPEQMALMALQGRWTFAQLDRQVDLAARRLQALGVEPGQRVAFLLRNGAPFVIWLHAVGRVGAVVVPLNTRLTPAELAWQLGDGAVHFLITDEEFHGTAVEAARQTAAARQAAARQAAARQTVAARPSLTLLTVDDEGLPVTPAGADTGTPEEAAPSTAPLRERIDLAAVHSILYTSGTTGRPKGAQLTYGNHWWSAVASALNLGLRHDDRWLACLPLFHVAGLSILLRSVIYGIPAVVHPRFDPAAVNQAIERDGVTMVSVVAAMLQAMLEEQGDRPYPDHLRCILVGGGPVPRPLLEECARRGLPVVQTYGLTETASQVATLSPAHALDKLGSAGRPLLPNEIIIAGDEAAPAPEMPSLPPYQVGEIWVRGPTVTPGYFRRPQDTARAIQSGWLRTGDLGYFDEDGFLYVVDRRDDLIISGGENVYPAEVEAVLAAHPAVAQAGVAGIPHPRWGQVPAAAVVLRPGTQAAAGELKDFCAQRLARYKIPAHIIFVDELPRNAAGKLVRHQLARLLSQGQPGA